MIETAESQLEKLHGEFSKVLALAKTFCVDHELEQDFASKRTKKKKQPLASYPTTKSRKIQSVDINGKRSFMPLTQQSCQQDACTGVHSACRREENGHNLDICVLRRLRLRQGQMQGFLGPKVGGGS